VKACQGVGGRTQTQVVDQKRTAGTGMSNGKVRLRIFRSASVSECECV